MMLWFQVGNQHQLFSEANMRENDENLSFAQSQIIMRNEIEFEGERKFSYYFWLPSPPSHALVKPCGISISIYTAPLPYHNADNEIIKLDSISFHAN